MVDVPKPDFIIEEPEVTEVTEVEEPLVTEEPLEQEEPEVTEVTEEPKEIDYKRFPHVNSIEYTRRKRHKRHKRHTNTRNRRDRRDRRDTNTRDTRHTNKSKNISETVVIANPERIIPKLMQQEKKWWHFKFKNDNDHEDLIRAFKKMNATVSIKLNDCGKKHPDIELSRNNQIVGKIHFLYLDRPNRYDESKRHVKLFFYEMNETDFQTSKNILVNFFEKLANTRNTRNTRKYKKHVRFAEKNQYRMI